MRCEIVHAHVAEVRQDLALDHVALGVPGVLAQPRAHAGLVDLVEGGESGVNGALRVRGELVLPGAPPLRS